MFWDCDEIRSLCAILIGHKGTDTEEYKEIKFYLLHKINYRSLLLVQFLNDFSDYQNLFFNWLHRLCFINQL